MGKLPLDLIFLLVMASAISMVLTCPSPIVPAITKCMQPVQHKASGGNRMMLMLVSGISRIKHLCRDGTIQEAFACLNRIYTSCAQRREDLEGLEIMVEVDKWKRAVSNICNSYDYLNDNAECESKVEREFRPCAERAVYLYHSRVKERKQRYSSDVQNAKEMKKANVELGCSLTKNILECLQSPYRLYCPKRMANLVIDTFMDFLPPVCVKRVLRTIPHKQNKDEEEENSKKDEEDEDQEENGDKEEGEKEEKGEKGEKAVQKEGEQGTDGGMSEGWEDGRKEGGKNMVFSYNEPVVFPKEVTKSAPVDKGTSGGRPSDPDGDGGIRNTQTRVRISHASDVARSRENEPKDGGHGGSSTAHAHFGCLLVVASVVLRYCVTW